MSNPPSIFPALALMAVEITHAFNYKITGDFVGQRDAIARADAIACTTALIFGCAPALVWRGANFCHGYCSRQELLETGKVKDTDIQAIVKYFEMVRADEEKEQNNV